MNADTVVEVFERVKMSFPSYKYVVVWTMGTYDLFKQSMEQTGSKMPRHRIVDIGGFIWMEKWSMKYFTAING